jgi:hypothetical protein
MGRREILLESDGLAPLGDSLVLHALLSEGNGELVVDLSQLGVDLQRQAVLGDGLVQLAFVGQGVAEVVMGLGICRIDLERQAILGDGLRFAACVAGTRRKTRFRLLARLHRVGLATHRAPMKGF